MQIYIGRGGQREGPFTIDEIHAKIAQGQARVDDLAWYEGAPGWIPLREVPGLNPPAAAAVPPAIPNSPPPIPRATAVPMPIATQQPQEGLAIASLILGILGLVMLPFIASVPGAVCGHMALGRIKRSGGALSGRGLAIGGLVTSYFGIAICLLVAAGIAIFSVAMFRSAGPFKEKFVSGIETAVALASAKNIHDGCVAYAAANGGKFPPTLEALVPKFLSNSKALEAKVGDESAQAGFQYFGGTTSDPPDRILFQSWGTLENGQRVVAYVNGRIELEETSENAPLEQPALPENPSKEQ